MRVCGLNAIGGQFLPPCSVGTEVGLLARAGLVRRIDFRPAGFRIEAREHVLVHVRLAFDEMDRTAAAFQEPQVAVARDVDQTFDGASAALEVDQDRRRDFVPVPGVVRMVLVSSP